MCFLGIEIGGTKLQIGVGSGDRPELLALCREEIDRSRGAGAIRQRILELAKPLIEQHRPRGIGIAFGGPIDATSGRTLKSHHVQGWEDFPLVDWCRSELGLPAVMGNDADLAGWAEAIFGAGQGHRAVFYITVGTGIGGALIYQGQIYLGAHGIAAELGHLRPGPEAVSPEQDLESVSAGWGIAAQTQALIQHALDAQKNGSPLESVIDDCRQKCRVTDRIEAVSVQAFQQAIDDLVNRCGHDLSRLTTKMVGEALASGNPLARWVFQRAITTLGWAIGQMITLVAPSAVVIGGGVSLLGERLFFQPLREAVKQYVFPAMLDRYVIVPAKLGEEVMVHGALLLARSRFQADSAAKS